MGKWAKTLSTRTGPISLFLCKYWGLITQIMPCIEQKAIHIKNRKWLKFPIVFFMIDVTCINICVILNLFFGGKCELWIKYYLSIMLTIIRWIHWGVFYWTTYNNSSFIHAVFFSLKSMHNHQSVHYINYTVYIKLDCSNIVKLRYLKCDGTV